MPALLSRIKIFSSRKRVFIFFMKILNKIECLYQKKKFNSFWIFNSSKNRRAANRSKLKINKRAISGYVNSDNYHYHLNFFFFGKALSNSIFQKIIFSTNSDILNLIENFIESDNLSPEYNEYRSREKDSYDWMENPPMLTEITSRKVLYFPNFIKNTYPPQRRNLKRNRILYSIISTHFFRKFYPVKGYLEENYSNSLKFSIDKFFRLGSKNQKRKSLNRFFFKKQEYEGISSRFFATIPKLELMFQIFCFMCQEKLFGFKLKTIEVSNSNPGKDLKKEIAQKFVHLNSKTKHRLMVFGLIHMAFYQKINENEKSEKILNKEGSGAGGGNLLCLGKNKKIGLTSFGKFVNFRKNINQNYSLIVIPR